MSANKIFVTGGAGFIGSHFIRQLYETTDWQIVNLDKLTYAGNLEFSADIPANRLQFVRGDVTDQALVSQILRDHDPQIVVHFAAETHVDRSIDNPMGFVDTNIVGTAVLLESLRHHWHGDDSNRRFIQVSTDEVFGSLGLQGKFSENAPYAPRSPYAASKASSDHLVQAYHQTYQLPVIITHSSNNYGSNQFPEKLIPLAILNALEDREIPIYGNGMQVRNWLHVQDHVEALLVILRQGRIGQSYNIGGKGEQTNLMVVESICELVDELRPERDHFAKNLIRFVADRPAHDLRYAIDITKIQSELGWAPRIGFADGLRSTVRWYLENRKWVTEVRSGTYRRQRLGLSLKGDRHVEEQTVEEKKTSRSQSLIR